jgi:hypothetical protein
MFDYFKDDFFHGVFATLTVISIIFAIIGRDTKTEHQTTQPVKPIMTITNVDGVVDTTYTYTFELLPNEYDEK